ncbi:MAG: hypothetical protein JXB07_14695 [Anaerolineae bacterium]|nr:hypothetical protein [Anaerolineae bacterium]
MSDFHQQMAGLGKQIAELESHLGEVSGNLAEIHAVMAPFLARYQDNILHYYDNLVQIQRELADLRAEHGDLTAVLPGQAVSPLDRFTDQNLSVDEQYARRWQGKKSPRLDKPQNLSPATPEIKQLYARVVAHVHPDLSITSSELTGRKRLLNQANHAYVQRDEALLKRMAESCCAPSIMPAIVTEKTVKKQQMRVQQLEMLITKIEGQYFDLRYGLPAKIKAYAEMAWAEEKRDLIGELSAEIRQRLQEAQLELTTLRRRP